MVNRNLKESLFSVFQFKQSALSLLLFLFIASSSVQAQFTQISGAKGLDYNSAQSGGHAWGDFDNDGDLDVIIHAGRNPGTAKLYFNNGAGANFTFTDTTDALIDGFNDNISHARQMLIADMNNDGYQDIIRSGGGSSIVEVYINQGAPAFEFGDANNQPNFTITSSMNGDGKEYNLEGAGVLDWNYDGYLDIILDNDNGGLDIYQNNLDTTFVYVDPGTGVGETGFLADHDGQGDYLTLGDVDNDGYVDLMSRKDGVDGYWRYDPSVSQFVQQSNPDVRGSDSDKGGNIFCDFDNDGDLDLFWTSQGTNQIWRNDGKDGSNNDIWTAIGLPGTNDITTLTDIDGCDCGDVDHDGDIDIVIGASSGNSYLLENLWTVDDSISFDTTHIATSANTESMTLIDFDNDGDLDLYTVVDGGANQLWENGANDGDYLYVETKFDNGNSSSRYAIGANVVVTDCAGNVQAMRQVNGSKGHGSMHQAKLHFGLNASTEYKIKAYFIYENGTRSIVQRNVIPVLETNQTITIMDTDASVLTYCQDQDGDGITDIDDQDDDNDGIADVIEICGSAATDFSCLTTILFDNSNDPLNPVGDEDGDGILNYEDASDPDVNHASCTDADNDGHCDSIHPSLDFDADGRIDAYDLDTDNDGLPDVVEAGVPDTNNDGKVDGLNGDGSLMTDVDSDGFYDTYDPINDNTSNPLGTTAPTYNSDNLGHPNFKDLDSDDDGITDVVENAAGSTLVDATSGDLDGMVEGFVDLDDDGWKDFSNSALTDSDSDGIPDYRDIDADNDGIPDFLENVCTECPTFGVPSGVDSDGNGVLEIFESITSDNSDNTLGSNTGVTPNEDDNDMTGPPDYLDIDSDQDGAYDWTEGFDTSRNHQAMDELILFGATYDSNQGFSPGRYPATDSDNDNIPDWLDNQNGTMGYTESSRPPFLDPTSPHWFDDNNNGLADVLDAAMLGVMAPTPGHSVTTDADWRDISFITILPVDLMEFEAKVIGCEIVLNWMTTNEDNFDFFELERSSDGNNFKSIHTNPSNGGNQVNAYQYQDKEAENANYYRLKMVDLDGSFEYSDVQFAKTDCSEETGIIDVYPNPMQTGSDGILTVKLFTNAREMKMSLTDINGQPVRIMNLPLEIGWNTIRMDLSDLPGGVYQLSSEIDGNRKTKQIVRFNED